jgi:WS/DGAT/MGAT family acyltransferase
MTVDRVTADDRLMLFSDETWPQDIGALAVLDGTPLLDPVGRIRIDAARDAIDRRLHLLPRFRQVLYRPARGLGWPLWVDSPDFDIRDHVGVVALAAPADDGELLRAVETLRARRLDPDRPLWEMWFLPGLSDSRVAIFIRLHHVVADGIAGVAALRSLLETDPGEPLPPGPAWTPTRRPTNRELLRDNVRGRANQVLRWAASLTHPAASYRRWRAAWPALRELLTAEPGPRTGLNRLVGPHRTFALLRTGLDDVRHVARAHSATVNDVLLTVTAGGLRNLLQQRGEPVENLTLPIYVPVSLRPDRSHPGTGNLISQMVVPLPLGTADPAVRLRQIATSTATLKATARPSLGNVFRSRLLARLLLPVVAGKRVNVETADLPGPPVPLSFCGARVLEVFPLLNLIGNVSLGVGALSYAGQFGIMAVGDADGYPDIDVVTEAAREELQALVTGRTADNFVA